MNSGAEWAWWAVEVVAVAAALAGTLSRFFIV
jgi:hypothetical protein